MANPTQKNSDEKQPQANPQNPPEKPPEDNPPTKSAPPVAPPVAPPQPQADPQGTPKELRALVTSKYGADFAILSFGSEKAVIANAKLAFKINVKTGERLPG